MENKLKKLLSNAYAPYSKFKVAAILVTKSGKEYMGVNVENPAYPATICAERSAIVSAISNGEKMKSFKEINIISSSLSVISPCGICRQVMLEALDKKAKINCYSNAKQSQISTFTINELMVFAFEKKDLN